jgi:hypothetical protein
MLEFCYTCDILGHTDKMGEKQLPKGMQQHFSSLWISGWAEVEEA